jgi:hypothetical protein
MKGLIHIHSNYSDGELSLQEIKKEAKSLGADFVLMADHIEYFSSQKEVDKFVEECEKLSDNDFLMIPGLEISPKDSYHILVYNGRKFIKTEDLIKGRDQLIVLAHASHYSGRLPEEIIKKLDGMEVWSAKYDSKHAPNIKSYSFLEKNNLIAMAGLDSHGKSSLNKLWVEIDINDLNVEKILSAFIDKKFIVNNGYKKFDINKPFSLSQKLCFLLINFLYFPIRTPLTFFSKMGIKYPKSLKKIFHKLF